MTPISFLNSLRRRLNSRSPQTTFGDVDISGYFAAGRDINVRNVAVVDSLLEKRDARIRRKLITKVLPAWVRGEEYWRGGESMDLPASMEFGISYVARQQLHRDPMNQLFAAERWESMDVNQALEVSSGKLLILGNSGTGKTRALHKIMHTAINQATLGDHSPVPFYLHLSEWSGPRKEMWRWFVQSIHETYGVPQRILVQWLTDSELMLILDGLDELRFRERRECISALNKFVSSNPGTQVVVASRLNEYRDTGRKLNLKASLVINEIDERQVSDFVGSFGDSLSNLNHALGRDGQLRQLLCNPLMLRLAISVYSAGDSPDFAASGDRRRSILAAYVNSAERSMKRGADAGMWLAFTALGLREQRRSLFCPDRAPVEFLPNKFKKLAETRTLLMAFLFVAVPSFILRLVMALFAPESPSKSVHLSLAFAVPITYGSLAWMVARGDIWAPAVARRTSVARSLFKFAKRLLGVLLVEGVMGISLVLSGAADDFLGGICLAFLTVLAIFPALKMARESQTLDPSEMPDRVGGEISNLVRSTVTVAILVSAATYVTLSAAFYFFRSASVVSQGMLYSPLLNSFFYVVPTAFIAALRNGGLDLIRRGQCRRIMTKAGYFPRRHKTSLEEARRVSLLVPRRGALEFRHPLIRDYLSECISGDGLHPFVSLRSTQKAE
ncbi:NACHT domain-containing protein [Streptomyces yatensis]|nr:NACHT domain-containing protein [Streptomyces yatensis]